MPIIGVTSFPDIETKVHRTNTTYIKAIRDAGGIPLQLPTVSAEEAAREMLAAVDGLLLPGGPDMNPLLLSVALPGRWLSTRCAWITSHPFIRNRWAIPTG